MSNEKKKIAIQETRKNKKQEKINKKQEKKYDVKYNKK